MKYLVRWEDNWGDEITLEGWKVMDQTELDAWKSRLQETGRCFLRFGKHQVSIYESGQEILDCCTVKPIPDADAEPLQRLFEGSSGVTRFVYPQSGEEEEEWEDEDQC